MEINAKKSVNKAKPAELWGWTYRGLRDGQAKSMAN